MKKSLLVILSFVLLNVFLTACGNNGDMPSPNQVVDNVQQGTENVVSDIVSGGENLINMPSSNVENNSSQVYEVNSDYMQWTYTDWQNATQEQRDKCNEVFSNAMGRQTDVTTLGKIFGTNPNKNLSEIIELQKSEESSLQEGEQPDPGHGAAAGFM